jgi:hypothetical protein
MLYVLGADGGHYNPPWAKASFELAYICKNWESPAVNEILDVCMYKQTVLSTVLCNWWCQAPRIVSYSIGNPVPGFGHY